jgi:Ca2+/H+ antiporter
MSLINPNNPVYNSIIFYILTISIILLLKPKFMYCYKTNKFKTFGFGKHKTFFSFPCVAIILSILFYMIFLWIEITFQYLDKIN